MNWKTDKYVAVKRKYEYTYKHYNDEELEAEEFNLKEEVVNKQYTSTEFKEIIIAYFAAILIIPQIIKDVNTNTANGIKVAIYIVIMVIVALLAITIVLMGFRVYYNYKCKQYRLRLRILNEEKEKRLKEIKNAP